MQIKDAIYKYKIHTESTLLMSTPIIIKHCLQSPYFMELRKHLKKEIKYILGYKHLGYRHFGVQAVTISINILMTSLKGTVH